MSKKRNWIDQMTEKQRNNYENLKRQADKFLNYKHTHGQAYRGVERYLSGVYAFCAHLAIRYGSTNFRNIRGMHLSTFIADSKEAGIAVKTIKSELSAVRKFHILVPDTRYTLDTNQKLGYTDKRSSRGIDRAWRDSEYKAAVDIAKTDGNKDKEFQLKLARTLGLRIHEATKLTRSQIHDALRNDYLHVKGKGGVIRDVPLSEQARKVLIEIRDYSVKLNREKIFVEHGKQHHQVFKSMQNWIQYHRPSFQESYKSDSRYLEQLKIDVERPNLTFHGLRHAFAREEYNIRIESGMDPKQARVEVSELLGHGRDDVTRIYLAQ